MINIAMKYEVAYGFQIAYLHLTLAYSKVKIKVMLILSVRISKIVTDRANNMKYEDAYGL